MPKTSKSRAILNACCPRCRRGKIFDGKMYGIPFQQTLEHCPHCGLRYEIEPGYFYAAMYVSYAMTVAELVSMGVTVAVLTGSENPWLYVGILLSGIFLLSPFNFRYSRVILLHWLSPKISYNASYDVEHS